MRRLVISVVLAACASTPAPAPTLPAPEMLGSIEQAHDLSGQVVGDPHAPIVAIVMASWCERCRAELAAIDSLRAKYPRVRWVGINYKGHEEYDQRGNSEAIRELAARTPWLEIVPADESLFGAIGRPTLIPTMYVFDSRGNLVARFDRRERKPPDRDELDKLLATVP